MQQPTNGRRGRDGNPVDRDGKSYQAPARRGEGQAERNAAANTVEKATDALIAKADKIMDMQNEPRGRNANQLTSGDRDMVANIDMGDKNLEMTGVQAQALARLAIENEALKASTPGKKATATTPAVPGTPAEPDATAVQDRLRESMKRIMASPDPAKAVDKEIQRGMLERQARRAALMVSEEKVKLPDTLAATLGVMDEKKAASPQFDANMDKVLALPAETKKALGKEGAVQAVTMLSDTPPDARVTKLIADAMAAPDAAGKTAAGDAFKASLSGAAPAPAAPAPRREIGDDFSMVNPADFAQKLVATNDKPPMDGGSKGATPMSSSKATANLEAKMNPTASV